MHPRVTFSISREKISCKQSGHQNQIVKSVRIASPGHEGDIADDGRSDVWLQPNLD